MAKDDDTTSSLGGTDTPGSAESEMTNSGVRVTVEWGYEQHSLLLTPQQWSQVVSGSPLSVVGPGYAYEGEFFQDYWSFAGGMQGDLIVTYGHDGGSGFDGKLEDAAIEFMAE